MRKSSIVREPFEVERFHWTNLRKSLSAPACDLNPLPGEGFFIPTSSGKAALCLALQELRAIGTIKTKNDPVLVPRWLGYWVYSIMHSYAFPVLEPSPEVRVVMVYHQYGFAQDMDAITAFCRERDVVLIEDCAHALGSTYKGRRLGTFGDFTIFSFSKYFPCLMAGGLWVRDEATYQRIRQRMARTHNLWTQAWSLIVKAFCDSARGTRYERLAGRLLETSYIVYDHHPRLNPLARRILLHDLAAGGLQRRQENWHRLRTILLGTGCVDDLEKDALPYVVPVKVPEPAQEQAVNALRRLGLKTGFYHFDTARNLLAPQFELRLWVPVHQGLGLCDIERIGETLRVALQGYKHDHI